MGPTVVQFEFGPPPGFGGPPPGMGMPPANHRPHFGNPFIGFGHNPVRRDSDKCIKSPFSNMEFSIGSIPSKMP
jgi:hypothetical protein